MIQNNITRSYSILAMCTAGKSLVLIISFCLVLSGLIMVTTKPTIVQAANNKLTAPEFSVKLVSHPYDVPTTTTEWVDPYTGEKTTTTNQGYHVENRSIEITIKNRPFTPRTNADGIELNPYYRVQVKGSFSEEWKDFQIESNQTTHYTLCNVVNQSNSEDTFLSGPGDYPDGSKLDFRVQLIHGYLYDVLAGRPILPLYDLVADEESDWSIQTISINTETASPTTPSTTTTISPPPQTETTPEDTNNNNQTQPIELTTTIILLIGVIALIIGSVIALSVLIIAVGKRMNTS